jgi:putative flippase GtrA
MAIGLFNVFVDWGIYFILTRLVKLDEIPSRIISSCTALVSSYIWNRLWTFRGSKEAISGQFVKFIIVNGMGLVWNNLLFALFVKTLGIYDLIALVLTTIIVFFWNFGLTKIWAFRDR